MADIFVSPQTITYTLNVLWLGNYLVYAIVLTVTANKL